jgi:hypothetical protein
MKFGLAGLDILNILWPWETTWNTIWVDNIKNKNVKFIYLELTKLKVTTIDEKDRELKGISSSEKSWHSDDSGPGEKWGFFSFAKNIK